MDPRPNGSYGFLLWGVPASIVVATFTWVMTVEQHMAALQQQVRQLEASNTRQEQQIESLQKEIRLSTERVDRMDTPLAKIVEQTNQRTQSINDRLLRIETKCP